ncbi:MAG: hypothetical protein WA666_10200 [Nitrospirota bacterium]
MLTSILTRYIKDRTRRRDAGAKLYAAFAQEIRRLEEPEDIDTGRILTETVIERHIAAAYDFRCFLSPKERIGFDIAWREYKENTYQYADCGSLDIRDLCRKCALECIHNILQFTEPGFIRKSKTPSCDSLFQLSKERLHPRLLEYLAWHGENETTVESANKKPPISN